MSPSHKGGKITLNQILILINSREKSTHIFHKNRHKKLGLLFAVTSEGKLACQVNMVWQ